MPNRSGEHPAMADHDNGVEGILRSLEKDPGATGPMYAGWVADQDALRREKAGSGTYMTPFDRMADLADEELRQQIADLIEVVKEPGQSPTEALKGFFAHVLGRTVSPADHGAEFEPADDMNPTIYGRGKRAADGDVDDKKLEVKDKKAPEVEIELEDEKDDGDGEKKGEATKLAATLERVVKVIQNLDKRLAALETRQEAAAMDSDARVVGRSVEANRGRAVDAAANIVASRQGIVRRGDGDPRAVTGLFAAEAMKVLSDSRNAGQLERLKLEATDALTTMQMGQAPILNSLELRQIAENLGIEYMTGSGRVVNGAASGRGGA